MKRMKASEFKAKCLAVLDEVEKTGQSVLILKRGRIVARLTSPRVHLEAAPWRNLRGKMEEAGDIVGPVLPPEIWNVLKGEHS